ncbi:MAG TPA: hypothetical protein VIT45_12575 [Allosphingosinicella sp.]
MAEALLRTHSILVAATLMLSGCREAEPTQAPVSRQITKALPAKGDKPAVPQMALPPPPREPAKPSRIIPVRAGRYAEWEYVDYLKPVGYRMGDVMVVVRGPVFPEGADPLKDMPSGITRQIRIQAPRRPDYVHELEFVVPWGASRFGHGRLDRGGTRYVLVQTDSWGARCCSDIDLFILRPGRTEHVALGSWAGFETPDVRDYDGDGLVDFVVTDESFSGVFASHSVSQVPPMVLNVVDGKVRDVSAKRGFRPLFVRAARSLRRECTRAKWRESQDGACPAYVAAAARAGMFRKAWEEMLATYRHRNKVRDAPGWPSDVEVARYAEKLRDFLQEHGYAS